MLIEFYFQTEPKFVYLLPFRVRVHSFSSDPWLEESALLFPIEQVR